MTLLRRHKPVSVEQLRKTAEASAVQAKVDKIAVRWAEEAELAQRVVQRDADILQQRCEDDDRWDAERTEIAGQLSTAQNTAFDLSQRIERCRTALDDALRAGRTEDAASHGTALGSMQVALGAAQRIIEQLTNAWRSIPESDLTADERAQLPDLRAIALSPAKSHAHVVPSLTVDSAEEYRRLGRAVAQQQYEHPRFVNTPRPMVDARG